MFSFRKKDKEKDKEEKERKKREKKEKKEAKKKNEKEKEPMTQEELERLEDVKKGLFHRSSEKRSSKHAQEESHRGSQIRDRESPQGTSDSNSSLSSAGRSSFTEKDAGGVSPRNGEPPKKHPKIPPKVPHKPAKGILKGKSSYGPEIPNHGVTGKPDDSLTVTSNTIYNLQMSGQLPVSERRIEPTYENCNMAAAALPKGRHSDEVDSTIPPTIQEEPQINSREKAYDIDLRLPALSPPKPPRIREVVLKRQPAGDFGFTLRRGTMLLRGFGDPGTPLKKNVIFAEPGGKHAHTGLLPGDRLVQVNGVNVEDSSREEIIDMIKKSGDSVVLHVQPIPELSELSRRSGLDGVDVNLGDKNVKAGSLQRSGSVRYKKTTAKSEDQIATEKAWLEAEQVWLVHRGGFAAAKLLKEDMTAGGSSAEGKCRVKLEHGDQILEVDEDDVEKCNPPVFDRAEDLATLRYLNESGVLHTMRQRYGSNLIHTYAGPSLLVVNPTHPLSIYSEKVIQMFRGCKQEDMPPHVYASAQIAYRKMLTTAVDQSIVFIGRSGSGKTTNAKHVLHYLITAAGSINNIVTVDKINAASILLEEFGNSKTIMNTNATRYSQMTTLDFDVSGQIAAASIQVLMPERSRVVRRPEGESTFHIFYQMIAGVDGMLRNELHLQTLEEYNIFMTPLQKPEDQQKATQHWAKVLQAMHILAFSEAESKAIFSVLAAIYHLGVAGAMKGVNNRHHFAKPASAQKAANLLGTTVEELSRNIFNPSTGSLPRASFRASPIGEKTDITVSAMEALEGFVIGLYAEAFNGVVSLINRSLSSNYRTRTSLTILDTPGLQVPASCGRQTGATFEELCHNYIQERLQLLFHDNTFTSQQDRFAQENIDCDFDAVSSANPAALVEAIDKQSTQSMVRASNNDLRDYEQRGLLWLLDEEAIFPGATDDSFMERLLMHHGEGQEKRKKRRSSAMTDHLLTKGSAHNTFVLQHLRGTAPVQYNATSWLRVCRENPITKMASQVLLESQQPNITQLFSTIRGPISTVITGSVAGIEGSTALRRVSSIRRGYVSGTAGLKRKSVCLQVKFQADSVIETIRRSQIHFIHCILPHTRAGLCELKSSLLLPSKNSTADDSMLDVPLVRAQIRGSEILEAVRIHRQGFPDHTLFAEFHKRFEVLLPPEMRPTGPTIDEKQVSEQILQFCEVEKNNFKLGLSQVFFRAGVLAQLEDARDGKIADTVIAFQKFCRGYLVRRKVKKLQVQHIAIKCIQRNVRRFMQIREWSWWKLYTKVQPVLNVHRTEEELKDREEELESLKMKLEKSEKEKNGYKQACDTLEIKCTELTADLSEEHTTSTHATEMLEAETAERMRLEKDFKDIQSKFHSMQRKNEQLEMEVMQARLWTASALEDEVDEDEVDGSDIYKQRWERAMRELDFMKRKVQQEKDEIVEQHEGLRKQLERKLHEAMLELEETQGQASSFKKKSQRVNQELQDMKLHLEESLGRNSDLEKKQRKFDSELHQVTEEFKDEKFLREKIQREKDEFLAEKLTLQREQENLKMEFEMQNEKVDRLERELRDLSSLGTKDDVEIMNLKRAKMELELKTKDQEEELDEQAGTIQQLEQAKLRLEMNQQKLRQQYQKEIEEKEVELEEMRSSTQKKVRQLEVQVEDEYEEKQKALREKRELERQLQEVTEKAPKRDKETEKRLKKGLKKTKALLKDAQTMLDKSKEGAGSKASVKQLRDKLEDAEFATAAAIKARKGIELELQDLQQQLDDMTRSKSDAEDRCHILSREKTELQTQLEDLEEEMNELMRKYKNVVQQQSVDQINLSEQSTRLEELGQEREMLREQTSLLQSKVEYLETNYVDKQTVIRLESKCRELESRFDLEMTTRQRLEASTAKLKSDLEKLTTERDNLQAKEQSAQENAKRTQRQLRDLREEFGDVQKRELEASQKKTELEIKLENLEGDSEQHQSDLKLAFKRISDLQAAIEDDIESDSDMSDSEDEDDDGEDSDSSVDIDTFLVNHRHQPLNRSGSGSISSLENTPTRRLSAGTDGSDVDVHSRFSRARHIGMRISSEEPTIVEGADEVDHHHHNHHHESGDSPDSVTAVLNGTDEPTDSPRTTKVYEQGQFL